MTNSETVYDDLAWRILPGRTMRPSGLGFPRSGPASSTLVINSSTAGAPDLVTSIALFRAGTISAGFTTRSL